MPYLIATIFVSIALSIGGRGLFFMEKGNRDNMIYVPDNASHIIVTISGDNSQIEGGVYGNPQDFAKVLLKYSLKELGVEGGILVADSKKSTLCGQ